MWKQLELRRLLAGEELHIVDHQQVALLPVAAPEGAAVSRARIADVNSVVKRSAEA